MNKYHYKQHDGREGFVLADDVQLINSDTTGLDNSLFPVKSWVFYRGGVKWMEMPAWMIHGEPKLLPLKERE